MDVADDNGLMSGPNGHETHHRDRHRARSTMDMKRGGQTGAYHTDHPDAEKMTLRELWREAIRWSSLRQEG